MWVSIFVSKLYYYRNQVSEGQVTRSGQVTPPPKNFPVASRSQWMRKIWNFQDLISYYHAVASPRGGKRGNFPPNLRSDTQWDQRDPGWFSCKKNGGRFTGYAPTFYMNWCYGERSLVLRLRKRGSFKSRWRSYFGRPSVKLRGPLRSFSPGIGPPKAYIFLVSYVNSGPLSKNSGTNPISFQFLTGVGWHRFYICPPPEPQNSGDAYATKYL